VNATSSLATLALGFVGSAHCAVMCGGIISLSRVAHQKRRLPQANASERSVGMMVAQHVGRLASYATAGALAGGVGRLAIARWQVLLELGAGLAMIGLGLLLCGLLPSFARIERIGAPLWRVLRPIGQRLVPFRTMWHALAFGVIWGWLPCGLVYSALSLAALSGTAHEGAIAMLAFGAGTLPAVVAVSAILSVARLFRGPSVRVAAGAILALLGAIHLTFAANRWHEPQAMCHAQR
jgi:sulfite exporter TauE/SafE